MTATIPKAELHVHLEGTAPPALVRRLAGATSCAPRGPVRERGHLPTGRTSWTSSRPTTSRRASSAPPRTTATSPTSTWRLRGRGRVYVELIASPGHADAVGLTDAEHFGGIAQGIDDARRDFGIEARILAAACATTASSRRRRSRGASPRTATLRRRLQDGRRRGGFPPGPFARAFAIAADAGLGCTVHAGEHAGPESVRGAMALPVTRISHGVRAIEDPALVAELAERGIVWRSARLATSPPASSRVTRTSAGCAA